MKAGSFAVLFFTQKLPELPQPFPIFRQEAVCFRYMLESDNII